MRSPSKVRSEAEAEGEGGGGARRMQFPGYPLTFSNLLKGERRWHKGHPTWGCKVVVGCKKGKPTWEKKLSLFCGYVNTHFYSYGSHKTGEVAGARGGDHERISANRD